MNIVDFGKVDTDLVDLQCFPEMIYGHNLTCDTEALVFKFAIIDDCYLLPSAQCCKGILNLLIHTNASDSIPVVPGHVGIHLTIILIVHTGDGFTVQNGRIGIHADRTKLPILNEGIGENLQSNSGILQQQAQDFQVTNSTSPAATET